MVIWEKFMLKVAQFRKVVKIGLVSTLLCLCLVSLKAPAWAEPTPLTPAAAKYEIEHAKSPAAAGQRMQQMSKDYKQELKKSPTPIPNAANNAAKKTKSLFNLFSKRVKGQD